MKKNLLTLVTLTMLLVTFSGCKQRSKVKVTPSTTQSSIQRNDSNTRQKPKKNLYSCPDDKHPHMIDLGLPSGTKWACCNVDTEHPEKQSPTNYGGYYTWGETEMKTTYGWSNYKHCDGSQETCHDLGSDIAGTKYDVAYVKWSGSGVIPSLEQIKEFLDNCTVEWTTVNGVEGQKFTSKINGDSIFLPAAGYRNATRLINAGRDGLYWSSTQDSSYSYSAYRLLSQEGDAYWYDRSRRGYGYSVRPVSCSNVKSCPDNNHPHMIDLGLPSGTKWACCNVDTEHPEKQSPTNYGGYYAWGETEVKDEYNDFSYYYAKGSGNDGHGRFDRSYSVKYYDIGSDIAGTKYDVAHLEWGGLWVMPSFAQIEELLDNCTYKWTTVNDVGGGMFTGSNGGCIFLPAAGHRWDDGPRFTHLHAFGSRGYYWSSQPWTPDSRGSFDLCFGSGNAETGNTDRGNGFSVRPVSR